MFKHEESLVEGDELDGCSWLEEELSLRYEYYFGNDLMIRDVA